MRPARCCCISLYRLQAGWMLYYCRQYHSRNRARRDVLRTDVTDDAFRQFMNDCLSQYEGDDRLFENFHIENDLISRRVDYKNKVLREGKAQPFDTLVSSTYFDGSHIEVSWIENVRPAHSFKQYSTCSSNSLSLSLSLYIYIYIYIYMYIWFDGCRRHFERIGYRPIMLAYYIANVSINILYISCDKFGASITRHV